MKRVALVLFLLLGCLSVKAQAIDEAVAESPPMADFNTPKSYLINNISVEGLRYVNAELLVASTGLQKGDSITIPGNAITSAIEKLWSQRFFSDVKIEAEVTDDNVDLFIILEERPRVLGYKFEGISSTQAKELTESMELDKGSRASEYSEYLIEKRIDAIKTYYIEKGFRNTDVSVRVANDPINPVGVQVTFIVNKGSKVKIGDIRFEGNEAYAEGRLRGAMKEMHRIDWRFWNFFKGYKMKDNKIEDERGNILDFYHARGYRNATVVFDSIYPINEKRIGLRFSVDEGNKYYYRNISWVGNSIHDTEYLNDMLGIESGDAYDRKTLQTRLGLGESNPEDMSILSLYQNSGYLFSSIEPAEIIIGQDSLDLEIRIFEGNQVAINEVTITGNTRVNDEVIRRELYTVPGELYDRSLLMRTYRELGQTQLFNPEALVPDVRPVTGELVNIKWGLEEMPSDKFDISGGWGAGMFIGSVGVTFSNVSIRDFLKRGAWRPYPHGQRQQLSLQANSNGSYYKSFSASFTEPWLGGKKPNSLTTSVYYSDMTDSYGFLYGLTTSQKPTKHFRTLGISAGFGRRLSWPDRYFTLYNELGYQLYNLSDWDGFLMGDGKANMVTLKTILARNSVDSPLYSRSGSDISLEVALTPPVSMFDGIDYSDPDLTDKQRYNWIEYYKAKFKAQWFYPLGYNGKLVLMTRMELGYLGSYNRYKPSPFEGFDVGGDGMVGYSIYGVDIIALRGYENGALTPSNNIHRYANVYNKYTAELRYPLVMQPNSMIWAIAFAEAGNGYLSWQDFNPFRVKRSLGIGVRLYLPMIGLLGIDWGYGFDAPFGGTKAFGSKVHFTMGLAL